MSVRGYISYPIPASPDAVKKIIYDFIKVRAPEWRENDANLDTWISQAVAMDAADLRGLATDVPAAVFRWFGKTLIGLPAQEAVSAVASATITVIDTLGYTIPAGAYIGIRNSVGQIIPFQLQADVVISSGSSVSAAGAASLRAVTPGTTGTGLGGVGVAASLIDPPLTWVSSIVLTGPTAGGINAEDNDDYQNRLAEYLRLLSTRPILAPDFALRARLLPEVWRAVAIDNYIPAVNEQHRLTETGAPTGGTWTYTFNGQTTAALAWNISAAALQTAIQALSSVGAGNALVSGTTLNVGPLTIDFVGALAGANQPVSTVNAAGLTGGTAPAITVTNVRDGAAAQMTAEKAITLAAMDASGANSSSGTKAAILADLQANREAGFIINVIDPTRSTVDVTYQAKAVAGFNTAIALANVLTSLTNYLAPLKWGVDPRYTDAAALRTWVETLNVRLFNIAQIIENTEGIDYIIPGTLTIGKNGGAQAAADLVLTGPAALTSVGIVAGTVT